MDQLLLLESMAWLSSYITQSQQRQQLGLPVDEKLLREAKQMLRQLSTMASTEFGSTTDSDTHTYN